MSQAMLIARSRADAVGFGLRSVILFLAVFAASLAVALRLVDLRILLNRDVWFHADPDTQWLTFLEGGTAGRHPLAGRLAWFITYPVARAVAALGGLDTSLPDIQVWLTLLVIPLVVAGRAVVVHATMERLTRNAMAAVAVAIIDAVSAASMTVGSVPETYALSALAISVMIWLALRGAAFLTWAVTGVIAVGITLTNLIPLAILCIASRGFERQRWLRDVTRAVAIGTIALAGNFALLLPVAGSLDGAIKLMVGRETPALLRTPTPPAAAELGWSVGFTYLAPEPRLERSWASADLNPDYDFIFSYTSPVQRGFESWWRVVVTLVALVIGLAGHGQQPSSRITRAAIAIVLASAGLHFFYGDHYFVYALQWQPALTWIIGGTGLLSVSWRRGGTVWLLALLVTVVLNTAWLLQALFGHLAAA